MKGVYYLNEGSKDVFLVFVLDLIGDSRVASQSPVGWFCFGLSVVPQVPLSLQWQPSSEVLLTDSRGCLAGRLWRSSTFSSQRGVDITHGHFMWLSKNLDSNLWTHKPFPECFYFLSWQLLYALKSVGNSGVSAPAFISLLTRCALSESAELELRLAAIQAFRRMPCSNNVSAWWK